MPVELVVVANRLPVDRVTAGDGATQWKASPGGLVAALEPVMRSAEGAWVGWTGAPGEDVEPFDSAGMHLVPVRLEAEEVERYYEGMSNATLWPLYHDVIVAPQFHRHWWDSYVQVNRRFADAAAGEAAQGATVWVQDYQLQLVPAMLREQRPDLRIGFFNHIPFPPFEIFAQLPWRRQVVEGLLGADLVGFQRPADAGNFLRACRRVGLTTRRDTVTVGTRTVRAQAFPISVDTASLDELARTEGVAERAMVLRAELGEPDVLLLGVDRLDYTKGILHRLQAYGELLDDGRLRVPGVEAGTDRGDDDTPRAVLVQVATPTRERVDQYRQMRDDVDLAVGRINGVHASIGHPAVHYLHQSVDKAELAALYRAADVMLVTPLRDGMNLVAKEYVASRVDEDGALVLSEFTGAAIELSTAYGVNPHDIDGTKDAVMRAVRAPQREKVRRMRAMRKRVFEHDVARWAADFLSALDPHRG